MNNKRLEQILTRVVGMGLCGGIYMLDCYMGRCVRSEFSHTITTRTATDNNTFVMMIYE